MIPFDETILLLKKSPDPVKDIIRSSAYYLPLQMLYCELIKNKDLTPLNEYAEKSKYWKLVHKLLSPQHVKIWICQALYCYENIKD